MKTNNLLASTNLFSNLIWLGRDPKKKIKERFSPVKKFEPKTFPKREPGFSDHPYNEWSDPKEEGGRLTGGDGDERKKQAA